MSGSRSTDDGGAVVDLPEGYLRWRRQLVTPEAIYGTVLVSSLIALAEPTDPDLQIAVTVVVTSIVFWLTHVFAATIAGHGVRGGRERPLRAALADAVAHAHGFFFAPVVPILLISLGGLGVLPESAGYYPALASGVVILLALGVIALVERRRPWWVCLLGGLVTAALGAVVILLKVLFH